MAIPTQMKAMKVMKRKTQSIIAKGRIAKALVLRGSKTKTSGGLKREDIMRNKRGKIVSKRKSALSLKRFTGSKLEAWGKAIKSARKSLAVTGFVPINGKSAQGKAVYAKAKTIYDA